MARRRLLCLSLWTFLILPLPGLAQEAPQEAAPQARQLPAPRQLEVRRATSPIQVDGVLDEPAWADALVFDVPFEWFPGDNTPGPVKTDFLVTYDDGHLYAAWRAYDPDPASVRAHLADRDALTTFAQDDHVVLMVDPFNDERRAFQFRINPLGVQADAIFSQNDQVEDFSYDMIWDSAARIVADGPEGGYVVEVAIPLDQIRFPRTPGPQTWGFNVDRSYPRDVRYRMSSSPIPRGNACVLCQAVKVTGFEDIEPGRNLEVTPTLTASRTDAIDSFPGGDLEKGEEETDPGISLRWGITPNITLSATANPDFSQVEADAAQLAVNERFALFFPEKRPFFLEGIDFFSTPIQAIFTRTIVDPDWGLKLTGKEGKNAFGVFVSEDEVNSLLVPSNQSTDFAFLEQSVRTGVVRYRRDVGSNSTVGLLASSREGDGYRNNLLGIDTFLRFDDTNTLSAQILQSDSEYPLEVEEQVGRQLDVGTGLGMLLDYQHNAEKWFWQLVYEDRDEDFRADTGFVPRVDIREGRGRLEYHIYGGDGDPFRQINLGAVSRYTEDHGGRITDQVHTVYANGFGPWQSFVDFTFEHTEKLLVGRRVYEGLNLGNLFVRILPNSTVFLTLGADIGDTVDFANNQPADLFQVNPAVELNLGRHVNARLDHTLRRLDVAGGELLEANLSQLRLVYNFNVRAFVRGIFQYLDLAQDPDLYTAFKPDPETEELFTQLLFSYKLNAQTVLFLGYSDNQLGFTDLERQQIELTRTDRTFFFKIGYAWTL